MRNLKHLDQYRIPHPVFKDMGDDYNGMFKLKIKGETYHVIASNGLDWEHVSISHKHKVPSWGTMCELKELFFGDEVVMQLHPKKDEYINNHQNCLHLWRPINKEIPTPPSFLVGVK